MRHVAASGLSILAMLTPASGVVAAADDFRTTLTCESRDVGMDGRFRGIGRSSILAGPTEIRVDVDSGYRVEQFEVRTERTSSLSGQAELLCRSSPPATTCRIDFGDAIVRRTLRVAASVVNEAGARREVSRRLTTLDTHPSGEIVAGPIDVLVERSETRASPPDEVRRLVSVVRGDSHIDDLRENDFSVRVPGIRGARIVSVSPPDPRRPKLIPVLFNVALYLEVRGRGAGTLGWRDGYAKMVFTLIQGLETAARSGTDAEYLVVAYAVTGRLFPPFRLHPGTHLDAAARTADDDKLEALERFLMEPPPPEWNTNADDHWGDDFGSVIHTLNDLYLREYDGLVQGVWITGGWHNPSEGGPRFLYDLWPERLLELSPTWTDADLAAFLERLDRGADTRDDELSELVASLDPDDPRAAAYVTDLMRRLDPGGTSTLHPHRVDLSPVIDVLLVPSDRSLRQDRMMEFSRFVRENYGGEIFRLFKLDKTVVEQLEEKLHDPEQVDGARTVAELIRRIGRHLDHSYVVDIEVPNPKQDGGRRPLDLRLAGKGAKGARPHYMPYYTSSRSVRWKLAGFLQSPIKSLRMLAAYELRNHWADEELYAALVRRFRDEQDPQVRAVVFESWIAVSLKQLQDAGERRPRSRDEGQAEILARLRHVADNADTMPDPELAHSAAAAADRYWRAAGSGG